MTKTILSFLRDKLLHDIFFDTKYVFSHCDYKFQIAFQLAKTGRKVLFVAAKAPDSLPIDDYADIIDKDILKNIVFSYSANATDLISYFLTVRNYQPKPDVIVVDFLHTFFDSIDSLDTDDRMQLCFIDNHMLITAALFGVIDMLSHGSDTKFISVVCIDTLYHHIYNRFIQTYVDLYYYKEGTIFSSFGDLTKHLV